MKLFRNFGFLFMCVEMDIVLNMCDDTVHWWLVLDFMQQKVDVYKYMNTCNCCYSEVEVKIPQFQY